MKKIKITEEQAKRLKLITEETNPLVQFEQFVAIKVKEVNNLYGKVINLNVAEIINGEPDMTSLWRLTANMHHALHAENKKAYAYIEHLNDDNLDLRIDKAYSVLSNKITSLELIITNLETLQDEAEEHKLNSVFQDVKPIDITPSNQ